MAVLLQLILSTKELGIVRLTDSVVFIWPASREWKAKKEVSLSRIISALLSRLDTKEGLLVKENTEERIHSQRIMMYYTVWADFRCAAKKESSSFVLSCPLLSIFFQKKVSLSLLHLDFHHFLWENVWRWPEDRSLDFPPETFEHYAHTYARISNSMCSFVAPS